MTKPKFTNWWQLHNFLLEQKKQVEKSKGDRRKIDNILFVSSTVKIRIEYSHYSASEVLRLRMDAKAGDILRRNFETWLFFIRSSLDCLAQLIKEICHLELIDREVDILRVINKLNNHKNLQSLCRFLKKAIDNSEKTWFWHLNQLRNVVTHRRVVPMMQYEYIGMPTPKRNDLRFTLEKPCDFKSFVNKPELGFGNYAEDKFNKVYEVVEKVCEILYAELNAGNIKIMS
ncbi:unnamed protein product [marine sediment metagenome]|uniref:Uncharacterized protein n=1 Tax=marine sediment metagenome TaxID=412755 RepID=X1J653_9ZZZZ